MAEQNRGELRHYIAKSESGPFVRLAKGVTSMESSLNPQEITRTYLDDSSSTITAAFQEEWVVEGNIYSGDTAADMLHEMAWQRAKGDDATLYMIVATMWRAGSAAGSVKTYKLQCNWAPSSDGGGEGGSDVTFAGSIKAKGKPVYGRGVVTEATASTPESITFTAE